MWGLHPLSASGGGTKPAGIHPSCPWPGEHLCLSCLAQGRAMGHLGSAGCCSRWDAGIPDGVTMCDHCGKCHRSCAAVPVSAQTGAHTDVGCPVSSGALVSSPWQSSQLQLPQHHPCLSPDSGEAFRSQQTCNCSCSSSAPSSAAGEGLRHSAVRPWWCPSHGSEPCHQFLSWVCACLPAQESVLLYTVSGLGWSQHWACHPSPRVG